MKQPVMNDKFLFIFCLVLFGYGLGVSCPTPHAKREKLIIFHPPSLTPLFVEFETVFESYSKVVDVIREVSGSRLLARKIRDLGRECDLLISADCTVIDDILIPKYTDWYVSFMNERMVICYNETSKYGNEINKDNWYKVLGRDGVRIGRGQENLDPMGYRTLMVVHLADLYYKKTKLGNRISESLEKNYVIRPSVEIVPLLENKELDYIFFYEVVAKMHNLKYINLPEEIDLSNARFRDFYKNVSIPVSGKKRDETEYLTAGPILYSFTIPKNSKNSQRAIEFIRFMYSWKGKEIFEKNFISLTIPPSPNNIETIPPLVRQIIKNVKQ